MSSLAYEATTNSAQRCIYCLKTAQRFDHEHVIPRCAIKSIKHAPALYGEVCMACNNFYSYVDSITAPFKLASVLTALDGANTRFSDMEDVGVDHCCVRIRTRDFSMLDGARCYISSTAATGYTMHLEPRIGVLKGDKGFDMIRPERLSRLLKMPEFDRIYSGKGVLVSLVDSQVTIAQKGSSFELVALNEHERLLAQKVVRGAFEHQMNRAAAKISFNFLAWIAGQSKYRRQRLDLHGQAFDKLRAFIRGELAPDMNIARRLRDDEFERDGKRVHSIRLCVGRSIDDAELVAYVGMYGMAKWRVSLAQVAFSDFPYHVCYEWDFEDKRCSWTRTVTDWGA